MPPKPPFPTDPAIIHTHLRQLYHTLAEHYGKLGWWPGDSGFEIILGAILTQQTNWRNVEKALGNLKDAGILTADNKASIHCLRETHRDQIVDLIRPSGFFNQKADRVLGMARYLEERWGGNLEKTGVAGLHPLRDELLGLKGGGNETADSILLYALGRPSFVVDTYTFRLLERLGIYQDKDRNYLRLQGLFEGAFANQMRKEELVQLYQQYHGLIVNHSKECCLKKPRCRDCFLAQGCPASRHPPLHDTGKNTEKSRKFINR